MKDLHGYIEEMLRRHTLLNAKERSELATVLMTAFAEVAPPVSTQGAEAAWPDSFSGGSESSNAPDTNIQKTFAEIGDAALAEARYYREMIEWLHSGSSKDPEGYEWGIYRVKNDANGQPVSVLHTLSDLSDLRAEMVREKDAEVMARFGLALSADQSTGLAGRPEERKGEPSDSEMLDWLEAGKKTNQFVYHGFRRDGGSWEGGKWMNVTQPGRLMDSAQPTLRQAITAAMRPAEDRK